MTAADILNLWQDTPNGFGLADDLRGAAMECQEEGIARKEYLEATVALGYNQSTASRCWSFAAK